MKTTPRLLISAALLLAFTLTGCNASTSSSNALIPAGASAAPTISPTPTAIPGDADGNGKHSEFEKQRAAEKAPRDFTLTDGTVVSVDPTQPLPAEVVSSVRELMVPMGAAALAAPGDRITDHMAAIRAEADRLASELGKGIVFTYQSPSYEFVDQRDILWVCIASDIQLSPVQALEDGNTFNAKLQTWAAPRNYEVIYIQ